VRFGALSAQIPGGAQRQREICIAEKRTICTVLSFVIVMKRPTLCDIAKIAKVSHVTVSLALRSHPRISQATRDRIQVIAREIGYRPDPVLAALMVYRHGTKPSGNEETLAWINVWPDPKELSTIYGHYWDGALERSQELGYKLVEFRLTECGMDTNRLSRALHARNVRGLLLPPQYHNRAHLHLDWENFSAISFGFTLAAPRLHVVTNAQFRSAVTAMRALRRLGHRRIGFALEKGIDERCDHNYLAGYLIEQLRLKAGDIIPPLIMARTDAPMQRNFEAWHDKHRPEAIITMNWPVQKWMREMGYREGKDYSLATLGRPSPILGGIDQNETLIGRTAVDLLVGMIHRSERGIPKIPLRTLIEGSWVGGESIRTLARRRPDRTIPDPANNAPIGALAAVVNSGDYN